MFLGDDHEHKGSDAEEAMKYNFEDGESPIIICLQKRYHNLNLSVDGLTYKKMYNPSRDVDYTACLRLLLKYRADPKMRSSNGKLPIFKAIKSEPISLMLFLEHDAKRTETINVINKKGLTPLCKLASQKSTEDNFEKVNLLLKAGASCEPSLPDHHALYIAMKSKNTRAVRGIFKFSDALKTMGKLKDRNPFLIELARIGDGTIFEECMNEWTKWAREKYPEYVKYMNIKDRDADKMNILHVIAQSQSTIMFKALINNIKMLNPYTDYTLDDVEELLN